MFEVHKELVFLFAAVGRFDFDLIPWIWFNSMNYAAPSPIFLAKHINVWNYFILCGTEQVYSSDTSPMVKTDNHFDPISMTPTPRWRHPTCAT